MSLFKQLSVFATSITLFFICIIGIIIAQATTPQDYKPSTIISNLFFTNQQKDLDPYTALAPDSAINLLQKPEGVGPDDKNLVAKLKFCDLALKFPKKVNNTELTIIRVERPSSASYYIGNRFSVVCFQEGGLNSDSQRLYDEEITNSLNKKVSFQTLTNEELREKTGWFLSVANIDNIAFYRVTDQTGNSNVMSEIVRFRYNNLYYHIRTSSTTDLIQLPLNAVQFQFNSLVTNTFTNESVFSDGGTVGQTCLDRYNIKYNKDEGERRVEQYPNSKSGVIISTKSLDNLSSVNLYCSPTLISNLSEWNTYVRNGTNQEPVPVNLDQISFLSSKVKASIKDQYVSVQTTPDGTKKVLFIDRDNFIYQISTSDQAIIDLGFEIDAL